MQSASYAACMVPLLLFCLCLCVRLERVDAVASCTDHHADETDLLQMMSSRSSEHRTQVLDASNTYHKAAESHETGLVGEGGTSVARHTILYKNHAAPQPELVIVVPFAHKQIAGLKDTLDLWSSMPTCRQGEKAIADLNFVASVHESDLSVAKRAISEVDASFVECFREVTYTISDLRPQEDRYPYAPNCLFFWMMFESGLAGDNAIPERLGSRNKGYKYIMQHELDVYPIAPMWLSTVVAIAKNYTSDDRVQMFHPWVIGAGHEVLQRKTKVKIINGNAIYVNDPQFMKFLQRFRSHFLCKKGAYDSSMGSFLANEGLESLSHFRSSPHIVDCGQVDVFTCDRLNKSGKYPITAEAVLVHAKRVNKSNWDSFLKLRAASKL